MILVNLKSRQDYLTHIYVVQYMQNRDTALRDWHIWENHYICGVVLRETDFEVVLATVIPLQLIVQ